jgi:cell division protein FtsN
MILPAHRTIRGRASSGAEIVVASSGKRVRADANGDFVIRSLSPGPVTLTSNGIEQRVDVPRGPATLQVNFAVSTAETRMPVVGAPVDRAGKYVVQIGAYRVQANAVAAAERARSAGVPVVMDTNGTLTLVRTEPQSQDNASAFADKLSDAGIEAVVMTSSATR